MNDKKRKLSTLTREQLQRLLQKRAQKKSNVSGGFPTMPVNETGEYPLSKAQERLFFLQHLHPENGLYNIAVQAYIRSDTPFRHDLLNESLANLIAAFQSLRTTFHFADGKPVQKIHPPFEHAVGFEDIRHLPEGQREEKIKEIAAGEVGAPIDIGTLPLFRIKLVRCSEQQYFFSFVPNHIVSDGWSNGMFIKAFFGGYYNLLNEGKAGLQKPPFQYIDYVKWEQEWLQSDEYDEMVSFWKQKFASLPDPLNLPLDRERKIPSSGKGKMVVKELEPATGTAIKAYCIENGYTAYHYFLAVFYLLLYRYSGEEQIVTGVPMANRIKKEFQGIFGLFLNTLPVKVTIDRDDTFADLLHKVKQASDEVFPRQHMPFDRIISILDLERDQRVTPLFQVLFLFQNIPDLYSFNGVSIEPYKLDTGLTKYDINIWIEEANGRFLVSFYANTGIFDVSKIEKMAAHYLYLLNKMKEKADVLLRAVGYPEEEGQTGAQVKADDPSPALFPGLFAQAVQKYPERAAVEFAGQTIDYRSLDSWSDSIAGCLQPAANTPVAIIHDSTPAMIAAILGIMKAGMPYLAIDPAQPQSRIAQILKDSGAKKALCAGAFIRFCSELGIEAFDPSKVVKKKGQTRSPAYSDTAYILYTSGSTGNPKGVRISHGALAGYIEAITQRIGFKEGERFAAMTHPSTDLVNTMLFPALATGGTLVLIPRTHLLDTEKLQALFEKAPVDYSKLVPSHLATLLRAGFTGLPRKAVILGGEQLTSSLVRHIRQARKECRIFNHYGPTETTVGVLVHEAGQTDEANVPIGKPLKGNRVYVLDTHGHPVPDGFRGELHIAGRQLADGYHNMDEATSEKFFSLPDGSRVYATGDMVSRQPDGNLVYIGRKDRQVKIRGHRVELFEIERVLKSIDGVKDVAVWYNGTLCAAIVADNVDARQIKAKCGPLLPEYMIPGQIAFLEELPLQSNGKIHFPKLKELFAKAVGSGEKEPEYQMSDKERKVAQLFARVLKTEEVHPHRSFFNMGGDSLKSVELLYLLNEAFGTNLPLAFLFRHDSVAGIAAALQTAGSEKNIVCLRESGKTVNLVFVHPAGGDIMSYKALGEMLAGDFDVYAIRSQGERFDSIEKMAGHYLRQLDSAGLSGQTVFCGWSMGALVAYEMARQAPEKSSSVIMIDQPVEPTNRPVLKDDLDKVVYFAKKAEMLAGRHFGIDREMLEGKSETEVGGIFAEKFRSAGFVPDGVGQDDMQRFLSTMIDHNELSGKYRPAKYDGKVVLIRAEETMEVAGSVNGHRPNDLYWGEYASGLVVRSCTGNHVTVMRSPNVEKLAHIIREEANG